MEKKSIGKFIAALRQSKGMTQKELGDMLYVSNRTVSRWERDDNLLYAVLLWHAPHNAGGRHARRHRQKTPFKLP